MSDVTNYDGRLEAMANYCKSMYVNIAKVNNVYYDVQENKYAKAFPGKYIDFIDLKKIGGKSVVFNQLVDTGTTEVATISGHKYYTLISGTASIITSDGTAITIVEDTADMVCDLTLCFGSGNEPSTTAEFETMFPAEFYAYSAPTLLSAGVTSVVSKDSTDTEIASYPIPAEIQALEGYGWSAGSAYNYIDYENKKFVQKVGSVDLGTLSWYLRNETSSRQAWMASLSNIPNIKIVSSNYEKPNFTTDKFITVVGESTWTPYVITQYLESLGNGLVAAVKPSEFANATEFIASVSGKYLLYELETPVETDISAYLTDDIIDVEAGGSLTFPNQHGDDYKIPVPVELEYIGVS